MADQATQQQRVISPALAEPTKHVRAGWVTGLSLAGLAMWMASYTPLQVLLPIQLQAITPRHKLAALGLVSAVLYGAGFGAYLAVDQALITQVLPAARDRAKDLGIINIAIVGPAALGGGLAALLVSVGGDPTLFAATAACGAIFVWRIKSVP